MKLNIESPNITVSDSLHNKIQFEFSHLEKFYERIIGCDLVLRLSNDNKKKNCQVEARLQIPKRSLFVRDQAESFEAAVTNAIDNLVRQLKREKEERQETW